MNSLASSPNVLTKVIASTVLLLSLTAQLSGQTRDHDQTLEGLRDIVLAVKYGRVEGPQEDWQTNLLPRLEDRLRQGLQEAGVPISESTDEAGSTSRPRLVFTVTLHRNTDTAPAVHVGAQIIQRVRLWRDSVKELELATWAMSGIGGPMVTEKMVLDVFDGQVAQFLKTYREVNPTSSQISTEEVADTSAKVSSPPNAFEGLNSTGVYVSTPRDMLFDGQPPVSQKLLQEAAENKLKAAGIKIVRYTNEAEEAGHASLALWVKLSPPNVQTWAPPIEVESTFSQRVNLVRDPKKHTDAVTWKSQDSGPFAKTDNGSFVITDQAVLEVVNRQLDEFIKAFKAARPPRQKAQNKTIPE